MQSSANATSILDDMIAKFQPEGEISFDDDSSNALFEAVAQYANKSKPLPDTPEEIDAYLESIPLFATKPPEKGKESDAHLAIQALAGNTPDDQLVEKFKEAGNTSYKLALRMNEGKPNETEDETSRRKKARKAKLYDALNHYYSAIENKDKLYNNAEDDRTTEEKDRVISLIHGNCAAAHLLLENHGYVVEECKSAIKLYKGNIKAYFRMAQSLFKLHKYQPAFIAVQQGMQQSIAIKSQGDYKQFVLLAQTIVRAWKREEEYLQGKYKEKQEQKKVDLEEFAKAKALCEKRRITLGEGQFNMTQQYNGKIYVGSKKELHFPVLFLYPTLGQSDFLQDVDEYTTIQDMLNILFPVGGDFAPWDHGKQYKQGNLSVWVKVGKPESFLEDSIRIDSQGGTQVEVPLKAALGHALAQLCKKGYIVPGFPTFCVTPKQ